MRRQYCGLIHAAIGGLLWALPAQAQELTWQQRDSEGMIFLAYEVPETGIQSLVLTCDTKSRQFAVHYQDDRDRVRDGMKDTVEFASEGGRKSLEMLTEQQELGDLVILRAETPLDAAMLAVLKGAQLRVTLSDDTENIPLAAAQQGVSALAAGCQAD